jgi:hypothetical protein
MKDAQKHNKKIKLGFKREYARIMDSLKLSPQDFSWKIRQRMKYDHNPDYIEVLDKYQVKSYAKSRGVQTAEVYYVTTEPETIPFDMLPEKYFLKANHGCAWNILYEGGNYYNWASGEAIVERDLSKSIMSQDEIIRLCQSWMKTTYSKKQWAYQHIEPKIMAEEKLESSDGEALVNYRCFVFDGMVKVINHDSPMYPMGVDLFVDVNWKPIDMPKHFEKPPEILPKKTDGHIELVKTAEKLGIGFDFVRVDLYDTTKGIVLGEMTVYPEAGEMNTPSTDPAFNQWLGDQWVLREMPDKKGT